ncbi:putative ribonuclease H protein At1g65750 family [Senna tora]|uniref:Putative ribonuclease H protein At1g65750 family n=1 Tax=Senna tora TaxID=362788 RepID=A0A835CGD3_9FABA|nr:putative ribonuclease H protein At1g65750 family [Senna tora]
MVNDLIDEHDLDFVAIMETRRGGDKACDVMKKIKLKGQYKVDTVGYRGGIWLFWRDDRFTVDVLLADLQFIHAKVKTVGGSVSFFTAVYCSPDLVLREEALGKLVDIGKEVNGPWIVGGDFNAYVFCDEKVGGAGWNRRSMESFAGCINECGWIDLGFNGSKFTWERQGLKERIDRCFSNSDWRMGNSEASVFHLFSRKSDHRPIVLRSGTSRKVDRKKRPFRFLASWLLDDRFKDFIKESWQSGEGWNFAAKSFTDEVIKWNKEVFGNIFKEKQRLRGRIEGIEKALAQHDRDHLRKLQGRLWKERGLRIRPLRKMNSAMLMKLGWRLIDDKDSLWARVIRAKYHCGNDLIPIVKNKMDGSCVWKSICGVWNEMEQGLRWNIGDGSKVNFWRDRWIPNCPPLMDLECSNPEQRNFEDLVTSFARDGQWDMIKLRCWFSEEVVRKIAAVPAPRSDLGADKVVWGLNPNGKFSVSSAFRMEANQDSGGEPTFWKKVWKWPGPQKFKSFLWLLSKERIFTNLRRFERRMTDDLLCPLCRAHSESALHAVRDCVEVKSVWMMIVKPSCWADFFNCNMKEWISMNLSKNLGKSEYGDWKLTFVVCAWRLWWRRNKFIFQNQREDKGHVFWEVLFRSREISEIWCKTSDEKMKKGLSKAEIRVGWEPPDMDWVKLNVDRAVEKEGKNAACGGLLRDSSGTWLKGFTFNIGECGVLEAELWGLLKGLEMAWDYGCKKVHIEMDSVMALNVASGTCSSPSLMASFADRIREFLKLEWEVRFTHAFREGNKAADLLAKEGLSRSLGACVLALPPRFLSTALLDD